MRLKNHIIDVTDGRFPEGVPWSIYPELLPSGPAERKMRNRGCALAVIVSAYVEERPHVTIEEETLLRNNRKVVKRTYLTPIGNVSEIKTCETGYYMAFSWPTQRVIKKLSDYDVAKFIIEDTVYHSNHKYLKNVDSFLQEDGIVLARADYPSLQKLIIELVGIEKFSLDFHDYPDHVEDLLRCMGEKQNQMYKIVAETPARIVRCSSNI